MPCFYKAKTTVMDPQLPGGPALHASVELYIDGPFIPSACPSLLHVMVESRNPHISIEFLDNDPGHSCHHFERTDMSKFSVNYLASYDIVIETIYSYIIF